MLAEGARLAVGIVVRGAVIGEVVGPLHGDTRMNRPSMPFAMPLVVVVLPASAVPAVSPAAAAFAQSTAGSLEGEPLLVGRRACVDAATSLKCYSPGFIRMPEPTSANGYADTHAPANDVWAEPAGTLHDDGSAVLSRASARSCTLPSLRTNSAT
jgi:hypothetical protein